MGQIKQLLHYLDKIIALENSETIETLSGYIVGELLGDYDDKYSGLYENNVKVQEIGDLASDLEMSNGTPEELQVMWNRIKQLADELKQI